jgi:adenylate kinase family enzyme
MPHERITIVGKPGSGKSTLSRHLATTLSIPAIEMDALFWQPNWTHAPEPQLRSVVDALHHADGTWVSDGNYRKVRDIIWARATTLVWLDYGLPLTLWRLLRRTVWRLVSRELLWGVVRESGWDHLSWDWDRNLFLFCVRAQGRMRREYPLALERPEHAHLTVLRFRHPRETEAWLRGLEKGSV